MNENTNRTTAADVRLIEGKVILFVHTLDATNQVQVEGFDIDAFALELANRLMTVVVEQKHSEGVA